MNTSVSRLRSLAGVAGYRRRSEIRTADTVKDRRPERALRIGRVLVTTAAVVIGGSSSVFACPMCFGAEETSLIDGTRLGILVMLGITLAVQGGFVGFFLYLRKRAKLNAETELDTEWSELQRSRT